VEITHVPTGIKAVVCERSLMRAGNLAMLLLRSLVIAGVRLDAPVGMRPIRSYDIDGPVDGLRIKDHRTGQMLYGDDAVAVLDRGELERFKRPT